VFHDCLGTLLTETLVITTLGTLISVPLDPDLEQLWVLDQPVPYCIED